MNACTPLLLSRVLLLEKKQVAFEQFRFIKSYLAVKRLEQQVRALRSWAAQSTFRTRGLRRTSDEDAVALWRRHRAGGRAC